MLLDRDQLDRSHRLTALTASEPGRYNVDISASCETRLPREDELVNEPQATPSSGEDMDLKRYAMLELALL